MRNRVKDLLTESNDSEDYNDFMQASYDQTYSNKSSVLSPSLKTNTTFIEENLNKKESLYPTLAIAYHNYAVEQEFLKDCEGSLKTYKKSFEIAKMHLGVTNSVTLSILRSYENAEKKFMEERKLKKDRKHMRDTSQRYSSKADFSEIENTFSHSSSKKFYPSKQAYYASKESAKKKDKLHAQVTMSHSMNRRQISLDKDNFFGLIFSSSFSDFMF
jgi:DNA polymerase III gamma/tau subunit